MLAIAAAIFLAVPCAAPVQFGRAPSLQPTTYRSPDGHWSLDVDPSHRDGSVAGTYSMHKDGQLAWTGERAWTLWNAIVTDAGFVAGFAYTNGVSSTDGDLRLIVLSPQGEPRVEEKLPRAFSKVIDAGPVPVASGVLHLPATDRILFRVQDNDAEESGELWLGYQLPGGKEIFRKRPRTSLEQDEHTFGWAEVKLVPGTPLILTQWPRFEIGNGPSRQGARYALFDADANLVWQLLRPDDWKLENEDATDKLWDRMREGVGLLDGAEPRHFALWNPAQKERLEFEVVPAPGEKPAWKVSDLASKPQKDPPGKVKASKPELPELHLEERSVVDLDGGKPSSPSPIHDIEAFAFESAQSIRVLRREPASGEFTLLHVDPSGQVLSERKLVVEVPKEEARSQWWPISDHAWLVTVSTYGEGAKAKGWSVDERTAAVLPLAAFDFPFVECVAGVGDGGFVALGTERGKYTQQKVLAAFDGNGAQQWHSEEDMNSQSPGGLFAPESIAVTGDGRVAVLDNIRKTLQFFDRTGKFALAVDLKQSFGQDANYPSDVSWDLDNGVLVHDFDGKPPLWRLDAAGAVRAKLTPQLRDGRTMPQLPRAARVAPDGKIWTTDGARLLRLDDKGVVDLELGAALDADVLIEPSAAGIDVFGRVLIQDAKTGAVHVFGGDGKRLFVGKPAPRDVGETDSIGTIGATRGGGVIVRRDNGGYLEFGPHGEPMGVREKLPDKLCMNTLSGGAAAPSRKGWTLFDEKGNALREIERRPDHGWLTTFSGPSFGADGSMALVTDADISFEDDNEIALVIYAADGSGGKMIPLPTGIRMYYLARAGEHVLMSDWVPECWITDVATGKTSHFRAPAAKDDKSSWAWGFSADGHELLGAEVAQRKLHHFALP